MAGDCAACHTAPNSQGQDFAGGYALSSPLGTIWSTNITPSKQYGIGNYTEAEFARAVRDGIAKGGENLYPAMPYDAYAGITDDDIKALYAYFMQGVKPYDQPPAHVTQLPFPFNIRFIMAGWNMIFADSGRFQPSPDLTAQQNRGKYLVDTLGHCSDCHTPRGLMMQTLNGQSLQGGYVGAWFAPNITADPINGIGTWSEADIADYLKNGRLPGKAQAAGPMAEAVEHSFQYMTPSDLTTIASYLKTIDAGTPSGHPSRVDFGKAIDIDPTIRGLFPQDSHDSLKTGAELYSGYCASCHQSDGAGSDNQAYPSLFHNTVTGAANANNLIATMLDGVDRTVDGHHVLMPQFGQKSYVAVLSDQEIASIANFVMSTYGNPAAPKVTEADVERVRHNGPVAPIARIMPYIPALIAIGCVVALLVVLAIVVLVVRRKRRQQI